MPRNSRLTHNIESPLLFGFRIYADAVREPIGLGSLLVRIKPIHCDTLHNRLRSTVCAGRRETNIFTTHRLINNIYAQAYIPYIVLHTFQYSIFMISFLLSFCCVFIVLSFVVFRRSPSITHYREFIFTVAECIIKSPSFSSLGRLAR